MDSLFGTRYHTEGATIQRPRKVPMRVEPKSYFGACQHRGVVGVFLEQPPLLFIAPTDASAHAQKLTPNSL